MRKKLPRDPSVRGPDRAAGGGRAVQGDEARGGAIGGDGLCGGCGCHDEAAEGSCRHLGFVRLDGGKGLGWTGNIGGSATGGARKPRDDC